MWWCDREGKRVASLVRIGRLKAYCTQLNHYTLRTKLTCTYATDITFISSNKDAVLSCFRCGASDIWKEMSNCYCVYCTLYCICVQSCDEGISDWEL